MKNNFNEYTPDRRQLAILYQLAAITSQCEKKQIQYAICGGYGLDGLLGQQTRDHEDIDLIVADRDTNDFKLILDKLGYVLDETETKDKIRLASYSHFHESFIAYKHNSISPTIRIEFGPLSLLDVYSHLHTEFIPEKTNASIGNVRFKAIPLQGEKAFIQIQNERAQEQKWNNYPTYKAEIRDQIIELLSRK